MNLRSFVTSFCALTLVSLAACNSNTSKPEQAATSTPPAPQQTSDNKFRVALLTPGPVSDAGWNALAYEGLVKVRDELKAEISQVETKTPAEFEEAERKVKAGTYVYNVVEYQKFSVANYKTWVKSLDLSKKF
mgnify:CR=1 FL=1